MRMSMKKTMAGKIAAGVVGAALAAWLGACTGQEEIKPKAYVKMAGEVFRAEILEPADILVAKSWNGVDYAADLGNGNFAAITRQNLYMQMNGGDFTHWKRIGAGYEQARAYQDGRLAWGGGSW